MITLVVNEMNKLSAAYNKTNDSLNAERDKLLDDWNRTVQVFMDKHMPVYE